MNRSIIEWTSTGVIDAVSASYSRSHLSVAIQLSAVALSVGVRALEKLWAMPSSAKNARVDRDVIWVPRSLAAAGSSGPEAASKPSAARGFPHASCTVAEVASGEKEWPTI